MSSFPSGIPDPPIFKKLGPKDRSHIRQNIERQFQAKMTTEQTYVHMRGGVADGR
jgi:nucleoside-diphosphate kinase